MSILKPSALPLELIENIIDEAFYAQYSTRAHTRAPRRMVDPQTLSSLARVSHVFRQRINFHRFSIVSFPRKEFKEWLPHIYAFLALLRSDVWTAPSMGLARHVRKVTLILGEGDEQGEEIIPHRAIADGTFTAILNTVFRGGDGDPHVRSEYALELLGSADWHILPWDAIRPDFIATIERLLDLCVATVDLKWLSAVPLTLAKRRQVTRISTYVVFFQDTPQSLKDFMALGPWDHLESLDIHSAGLFKLMDSEAVPMLKALTVTFDDYAEDSVMAESIIFQQPWNALEALTLNFNSDNLKPRFRVDYTHLPHLTHLTLSLLLKYYSHSSMHTPTINDTAAQILNLLGPHLPPLSRLDISIEAHTDASIHTHRPTDIPAQVDCASLDAVLAQYSASAAAALVLRFGLKLSRRPRDYVEQATFRHAGLAVVRDAFPRLHAGPRRRVFDSELAAPWEDGWRLLYGGVFSVMYSTAAAEKGA